ncbi:MAG: PSD1 and planctomycete cytochrome C domain-containing protein [Verrucomicrobiaceae bacterium]|nr:PSD1 and planctomycete cytochrome C domain-containing protein [Verrucomicrobiaceae bacterium]
MFAKTTLLLAAIAAAGPALAVGKIHFNRDIRPIMSDTCFHCHGPDKNARKANLRLDIREEALKPAKSGDIPITPGKPEKSSIIERIFTTDEDDLMPPEKSHKELTDAQKVLFKQWVAEGAQYEAHWAYTRLERPAAPKVENATFVTRNAVDNFIAAKLMEKGVNAPSPEADRAMLIRRVTLDLTGLPPTPDEVKAFVADKSDKAYEQLVDRLIKSPHFGERWAVWWLDVARFADTVGFHGDQNQRVFPFRDYVINVFNSNKRFDQFTLEQLAGDLLPNPTTELLVASGFNRLNMMTREGGAQAKEYIAKYQGDRVRTIGSAWLGSGMTCCECHDHKYDPLTQRDFYSLSAFFADVKQWGVYADYSYTPNPELKGWSNEHPFPPEIEVDSPYLKKRQARFESELAKHLTATTKLLDGDAKQNAAFAQWIKVAQAFVEKNPTGWSTPKPAVQLMRNGKPVPKAEITVNDDASLKFAKVPGKGENFRITLPAGAGRVSSIRLEALPGEKGESELGNGAQRQGIRLSASVKPVKGAERKLAMRFADADHKSVRYNNGDELPGVTSGWKLDPLAKGTQTSVWVLDPTQPIGAGETLIITIDTDLLVPLRLSVSPLADGDPMQVASAAMLKSVKAGDRAALSEGFLLATGWNADALAKYKQLHNEILLCHNGKAWTQVTAAIKEPLKIHILPRGNWQDESGPVAVPTTLGIIPKLGSAKKNQDRTDLARWLCSKENPLTPRAVMNRLWKQFFGNALSLVVDDLGAQGEPPSHPELLDYIAAEFRDSGWDMQHMMKLFVMSATYRQSSSLRPELREMDPNNRLLSSQNPRRLDAEFVRDNALSIAGLLNLDDIGGPSVKPYQPAGYYANLQFPNRDYAADTDERQWRRGVYMHWQRTFLHPMLANFDAPMRDECTANRSLSNTPQQALTLLNDPTFVEAARVFALRLLNEKGDDATRLTRAYEYALARKPMDKEKASLLALLKTQRAEFAKTEEDAAKLLKVGLTPVCGDCTKPAEVAAWTTLCRVLLNLQETITRY